MASGMLMKRPPVHSSRMGGPGAGMKQPTGLLGDITSAFKSQFPGVSKKVGELKGGFEDMMEGTDREPMAMMAMSAQGQKDFNPVRPVKVPGKQSFSVGQFNVAPPKRKQLRK